MDIRTANPGCEEFYQNLTMLQRRDFNLPDFKGLIERFENHDPAFHRIPRFPLIV
jgi:hypothetical protein